MATTRAARVLFVAGMPRSGTTLLEQALGEHPDVTVLGETLHLWRRGVLLDELCGCGERFSRCEFWRAVGLRAFGGWSVAEAERVAQLRDQIDHVRHLPRTGRERVATATAEALREYTSYFSAVHEAAIAITNCQCVVDTSKQVTTAIALATQPENELQVLHAVRDSRAVAHAWTRPVARPEGQGDDAVMPTHPPVKTASQWVAQNAAVRLLHRRRVPVLRLRYEDFADRPRHEVKRVLAFVGLDPCLLDPERIGDNWIDARRQHSVSGNPIRFQPGRIDVRRDDRWLVEMSSLDKAAVTTLTAPQLIAYGYSLRRVAVSRNPARTAKGQ